MSVLTACDRIESIYFELSRHPEWLWPEDPAANIPGGLTEELLSFSDDVATTVWLLLLWQEEHVATDFVRSVDVDGVYQDFLKQAETTGAAKERLAEEVDGLIETATMFGERVWNLVENGVIKGNETVRSYCEQKLENMLNAWLEYRRRLQHVAGAW